MLAETPTVVQRSPLAVGAFDHDARHRLGAGMRGEDTHLVVDQSHIGERRDSSAAVPCAARVSSAFTGPLPVATVINCSPPTSTVIVASDSVTSSPRAFQRRSSMTRKRVELEILRHAGPARAAPGARSSPRRRHRHSPRYSRCLHLSTSARDPRIVGVDLEADLAEAGQDIGAARLIRDHDVRGGCRPVSGVDMLIGARVLLHRGDMQPAFMGEGRLRRHRRRAGSARGSAARPAGARSG